MIEPPVGRELHRIRDEIVDHLGEPSRITDDVCRVVCNELDRDAVLRGDGTQRLDGLGRELGEIERLGLELDAVRLDLRDQQQFLDELVQPLGAAPDHVEIRASAVAEPVLLVLRASRGSRRST